MPEFSHGCRFGVPALAETLNRWDRYFSARFITVALRHGRQTQAWGQTSVSVGGIA